MPGLFNWLKKRGLHDIKPAYQSMTMMSDIFTKEKRSDVMSRIRSRGNKSTELAMIKIFRANGITGWRRHLNMCGKPDFVFQKLHVAVFVDGCFWHGCPKHSGRPSNNRGFWEKKLNANRKRDRKVTRMLRAKGWKVCRVWEHELTVKNTGRLLGRLKYYFPVTKQGLTRLKTLKGESTSTGITNDDH